MGPKFHERLIKNRPEFIGKHVWFCPNQHQRLECTINADGTISVCDDPEKKFEEAKEILLAISKGSVTVDENFKLMPKHKWKSICFSTHLFISSESKDAVNYYITHPNAALPAYDASNICEGFSFEHQDLSILGKIKCLSIKITGNCIRSIYCKRTKSVKASRCLNCKRARKYALQVIKRAKNRKVVCSGFHDPSSQATIAKLGWNKDRQRFNQTIQTSPKSTRSKNCNVLKRPGQSKCSPCKKGQHLLRVLKRRLSDPKRSQQRRLLHTGDKYLITPEKKDRKKMLARERQRKQAKFRKEKRRSARAKLELSKYRSDVPVIRRATKSMKEHLEKENERLNSPKCKWMAPKVVDTSGMDLQLFGDPSTSTPLLEVCSWIGKDGKPSLEELSEHVKRDHLEPKILVENQKEPTYRRYACQWSGCKYKPFMNFKIFLRHVLLHHVGNKEQLWKLESEINAAINANRKPRGRRYNQATRTLCSRYYRTRSTWENALRASSAPMPTVSTVLRIRKEVGGRVKSGIDFELITRFKALTDNKPEYRYGILIFDEVHVRPGIKFNKKSFQTFGYAEDQIGEVADLMLVFQFMSLFSQKRFALNIAWYACKGLTSAKLKQWFWEIIYALDYCGIFVLATVCDGSGVNRSFQDECLKDRYNGPFWMKNLAHPGRKIFILSDPSHGIKKWRNSGMSKKRNLTKGDHAIRFIKHVEDVRNWQQQQKRDFTARLDRELTEKHIRMTSFGQMNVQLAVDVCHHAIENIMIKLQAMNGTDYSGTRAFLATGRKFWLALNSRKAAKEFVDTLSTRRDLAEVMEYLDTWKSEIDDFVKVESKKVDKLKGITETAKKKLLSAIKVKGNLRMVTRQCHQDMILMAKGIPEFIDYLFNELDSNVPISFYPKAITQDRLERDFCILRSRAGAGYNPTVYCAAFCLKSINMNRLAALSL